ncbi:MAG: CRISPR-associated endoribonuclease Cas6, partial [bacterium]|nr:CRISPR-associated endoribonuclease Cas6 [bacterium]
LFDFLSANKPKLYNKYKKHFPLFTFSQLMIPSRRIEFGFINITGNYLSFFVSSVDETFLEYLAKAMNSSGDFSVHSKKFRLKKIDFIEEPEFSTKMKFRMLSPLLIITRENNKARFLRPDDDDLNEEFSTQLANQCNELYQTHFKPGDIKLTLDQSYIERKKTLTRLLTIRNINYKTIFAPIWLEGEKELIRFAYNNGIGAKTQYGLGMIDAV